MPIFDTFALAEAYAPSVAPDWIETAFYDDAQVAGSGARYRKNDGATGDLTITLSDGVTNIGYDIAVERPIIAQYGAVNTLDDRNVWQAAIDRLSDGETLAFPAGLKGTIRNGEGYSSPSDPLWVQRWRAVNYGGLLALTSNKNGVTIVINGKVDFTSALDDGFRFTGKGVKFVGENGLIANTSGDFLADNSTDPAVQWHPTLVRLDGDDCEVAHLHFLDHPTIGVWARGSRAKIHHNLFEGGPTEHQVGEYTVQFGVALAPEYGGGVGGDVSHNTFRRSVAGGAPYTAIFGVQDGASFGFNKISDMLEHGIYNYGAGVTILGNHIDDSVGDMTAAAIQNFAPGAIVSSNQLTGNNNHIALRNASGCLIDSNRTGSVSVRTYAGSSKTEVIEDLVISHNIVRAPTGQYWPISVVLVQPFKKLHIVGNITSGGGDNFSITRAAICVIVDDTVGARGIELLVQGNTVEGGDSYSFLARQVSSGLVTGNNFKDAWIGGGGDVAARLFDCDGLKFNGNHIRDGRETPILSRILYAPTADGNSNLESNFNSISRPKASSNAFMTLPDAARPEGNTQNNLPLRGSFTMPNTDAQNFNHTALRFGATIVLMPKNKEAWDLQASANRVYVSVVSNGIFQVATSSGSTAGSGGAIFDYLIIQ